MVVGTVGVPPMAVCVTQRSYYPLSSLLSLLRGAAPVPTHPNRMRRSGWGRCQMLLVWEWGGSTSPEGESGG